MMIVMLLALMGLAYFMPILWVAVAIFIVFWVFNKIVDEKIENMTLMAYSKDPMYASLEDHEDELSPIIKTIK